MHAVNRGTEDRINKGISDILVLRPNIRGISCFVGSLCFCGLLGLFTRRHVTSGLRAEWGFPSLKQSLGCPGFGF